MYEKVATGALKSYDGGDQGFLNSYYPDMLSAPLFENGTYQVQIRRPPLTRVAKHITETITFPISHRPHFVLSKISVGCSTSKNYRVYWSSTPQALVMVVLPFDGVIFFLVWIS